MAQRRSTEVSGRGVRRTVLEQIVAEFLRGYRVPAGFDAQRCERFVCGVAEALDKRLPSLPAAALDDLAHRLCEAVADAHDGHDWPGRAAFVRAAETAGRDEAALGRRKAGGGFSAEQLSFFAGLVNGEGYLPPSALSPTLARALVEAGMVTAEALRARGLAH